MVDGNVIIPGFPVLPFTSLTTSRFLLRPLRPDDATETYSEWFEDPTAASYIAAARQAHDVGSLRRYIEEQMGRLEVLFLGVFTAEEGKHIGNIKYEPVDLVGKFAVMGIFIGDVEWRGRGVAGEVIRESAQWLGRHWGIQEIVLGVARNNSVAIAVYEKIGFTEESTPHIPTTPGAISMVWRPGG